MIIMNLLVILSVNLTENWSNLVSQIKYIHMNINIKEPLKGKLNKAFTKLVSKNKFVSNKNDFIMTLLDNAIDDLYKSKSIS